MIKSIKQYLSLRNLLANRLKAKKIEIKKLGTLPKKDCDLEKCLAYANKNRNIKSLSFYYFSYENGGSYYEQEVGYRNMGRIKFKNLQHLIELNNISEKLK